MSIPLISHVNADGDILEAWFRHHMRLGISSFHLVVHGPGCENRELHDLRSRYPVVIEDSYEGAFDPWEKRDRLNKVLGKFSDRWVIVADSDEFLEFPYSRLTTTLRMLKLAGQELLLAPMLQHVSMGGSLDTPQVMADPFAAQPLCSADLYNLMGVSGDLRKFPLFYNRLGTVLFDGGNHNRPVGCRMESTLFRGVTHHFKFRRQVRDRLTRRMNSAHPFRSESVDLYAYLEKHDLRLPLGGAFAYSRGELFRRGLLVRPTPGSIAERLLRRLKPRGQDGL